MPRIILDSQNLPLTACPSLALISLHVSAGSSGMEPRGDWKENKVMYDITLLLHFKDGNHCK